MVTTLQKRGSPITRYGSGGPSRRGPEMDRRLKSGVHDVETARKHYSAMRNLIINHRGGSRDERTLERLGDLSRKAAAAIDDSDCKRLLSAVDGYAADLFSESGHLKWGERKCEARIFSGCKSGG